MTSSGVPLRPANPSAQADAGAPELAIDVPGPVVVGRHVSLSMIDVLFWTAIAALLLLVRMSTVLPRNSTTTASSTSAWRKTR